MRTLTALLLATLLAACAMTPNDVRLYGQAGRFERGSKPPELSACIARNLRNVHGSLQVWNDPMAYDSFEVGGRTEDYGTAILIQISPQDGGSIAFVYLNPQVYASNRDKVAAALMFGC